MSSPSAGGGPAAMPKYRRIAAALRHELDRAARTPGGRLPSERRLAARYEVNRQTIRAALQELRADGLIVTGRRGTRPAAAAPGPPAPPVPVLPAAPASGPSLSAQCWLTRVTVPPALAGLLGMGRADSTLVHHRREYGPTGETLRHCATYLSPAAVAGSTCLARYRDRPTPVRDEDLEPLHRWLERAVADGRVAETLTMTRTTHPQVGAQTASGLTVRRTVHDAAGRLLTVTDVAFPTWEQLTFHRGYGDHGERAATGFSVTAQNRRAHESS